MSLNSSSPCGSSNGLFLSEKTTTRRAGGGDRRKACDESKLCCRLIALHNKPLQEGPVGSLYIRRGLSVSAKCLGEADVGENVKCRFFLVPSGFSTTTTTAAPREANPALFRTAGSARTSTALEKSHSFDLFVCFNWYSPQTVWQKISSAYDIAFLDPTSHSQLLAYHGKRARLLFEHPSSQAILQKYVLSSRGRRSQTQRRQNQTSREAAEQQDSRGLESDKHVGGDEEEGRGRQKKKKQQPSGGAAKDAALLRSSSQKEENEKKKEEEGIEEEEETNGVQSSKKEEEEELPTSAEDGISVGRIVLSGFSQGAAFAHGFAILLKEETKAPQPMRVIGFGPPRFCFHSFRVWYDEHLDSDSFNVVLADEDADGQLVFDPVSVCGVDDARVAEQPNLYVLEQQGQLRRFSAEDEGRMLAMAPSVQVSKRSVVWNLMTRLSLVSSDYSKLFDNMHNIIAYYERLTAQPRV